jgi:hypothetical protein
VSRPVAALALVLALLAPAARAGAATLTDPSWTVGEGRLRLDGEAWVLLGRDIELEADDSTHKVRGREFAVIGSYGLLRGLDGFLSVGAVRLRGDDDLLPTGAFDSDVGFLFGGGVRYSFLEERYFRVGARLAVSRAEVDAGDVTATWLEYDLMLGGSLHVLRDLVPYLALAMSVVEGTFDAPPGRSEFRQANVVGAVAGLRYAATAQVHVTVAGRLFDQDAVAVTLSFGF